MGTELARSLSDQLIGTFLLPLLSSFLFGRLVLLRLVLLSTNTDWLVVNLFTCVPIESLSLRIRLCARTDSDFCISQTLGVDCMHECTAAASC